MSRWVNAVLTFHIPLDVSVEASPEEKREAALEAADNLDYDDLMCAATTVRVEDVDDGELIK